MSTYDETPVRLRLDAGTINAYTHPKLRELVIDESAQMTEFAPLCELEAALARAETAERELAGLREVVAELPEVVRSFAEAYPEDIFLPVPEELRAKDGIAADVLRRMIPALADRLRDEIQRLQKDEGE